jgi:hypothetical protein
MHGVSGQSGLQSGQIDPSTLLPEDLLQELGFAGFSVGDDGEPGRSDASVPINNTGFDIYVRKVHVTLNFNVNLGAGREAGLARGGMASCARRLFRRIKRTLRF